MNQNGLDPKPFQWSKDLFDPRAERFAYYEFGGGFGWINRQGTVVYDYDEKQIILSTVTSVEEAEKSRFSGKAYLQNLFQSFMDL